MKPALPLWTVLLACPVLAAPPKLEFDPKFVEEPGGFVARAEGKIALPDGAGLEGDLYYVRKIDPNAFVPPLDTDEEELPVVSRTETVKGGAFRIDLGPFLQRPYPGRYRVRVEFDPQIQTREVIEALRISDASAGRLTAEKDFRYGDLAELPAAIEATRQDIEGDFSRLTDVEEDLAKRFLARRSATAPLASGEDWAGDAEARIDSIASKNDRRLDTRISEIEPRAKFFIRGLCERLREIMKLCTSHLRTRDLKEAQEARRLSGDFREAYNEAYEFLGLQRPVKPERVLPHLERIAAAAEAVAASGKLPEAERAAKRREADEAVHAAVFALLQEGSAWAVQPLTDLASDWPGLLGTADQSEGEAKAGRERIRKDVEAIRKAFGLGENPKSQDPNPK